MYGRVDGVFSPLSRELGVIVDDSAGHVLRRTAGVDAEIRGVLASEYGAEFVGVTEVRALPDQYIVAFKVERTRGVLGVEAKTIPTSLIPGAEWMKNAQVAIRLHACLLFALLGGFLGRRMYRRETADAAEGG